MKPESKQYTAMIGGRPVIFETGKLAGQAGGAVTVRLGDSIVFAAATMSGKPKENTDFFPLTVDYEERMADASLAASSAVKAARPPMRSSPRA
jgi:polyribonucleotide nucleotidyltransferase